MLKRILGNFCRFLIDMYKKFYNKPVGIVIWYQKTPYNSSLRNDRMSWMKVIPVSVRIC